MNLFNDTNREKLQNAEKSNSTLPLPFKIRMSVLDAACDVIRTHPEAQKINEEKNRLIYQKQYAEFIPEQSEFDSPTTASQKDKLQLDGTAPMPSAKTSPSQEQVEQDRLRERINGIFNVK